MKKNTKKTIMAILPLMIASISSCSQDSPIRRQGDNIFFGKYPQTKVQDETLIKNLTSLIGEKPSSENPNSWIAYNYKNSFNSTDFMWYMDIEYSGENYRAVYFDSIRSSLYNSSSNDVESSQKKNGYFAENFYFFKWEDVKWNVCSNENDECFLVANLILDSQDFERSLDLSQSTIRTRSPYDTDELAEVYDSNYKYSSIRGWLNVDFYNQCFNEKEKNLISITHVDNSILSSDDPNRMTSDGYYGYCENTDDKVFLLSGSEIKNPKYGFFGTEDRIAYATDYAKCQGIFVDDEKSSSRWWTRTPCFRTSSYCRARTVNTDGRILLTLTDDRGFDDFSITTARDDNGVRPAIKVHLK